VASALRAARQPSFLPRVSLLRPKGLPSDTARTMLYLLNRDADSEEDGCRPVSPSGRTIGGDSGVGLGVSMTRSRSVSPGGSSPSRRVGGGYLYLPLDVEYSPQRGGQTSPDPYGSSWMASSTASLSAGGSSLGGSTLGWGGGGAGAASGGGKRPWSPYKGHRRRRDCACPERAGRHKWSEWESEDALGSGDDSAECSECEGGRSRGNSPRRTQGRSPSDPERLVVTWSPRSASAGVAIMAITRLLWLVAA
jgi:hypothetical protein